MFKKLFSTITLAGVMVLLALSMAHGQAVKQPDALRTYLTEREIDVIKELNYARQEPGKYAAILKNYAAFIKGNKLMVPGQTPVVLQEGKGAVEEAIRFLEQTPPKKPLKASKGLSAAAKDLAAEQGKTGATGHQGAGNSSPASRVEKYGQWLETVGENCNYGSNNGREIVIQLIVDDGVPSRGHRDNVFNDEFRAVGVPIGSHPEYGFVCVQDCAGGFKLR